jgi:hypothetical protein
MITAVKIEELEEEIITQSNELCKKPDIQPRLAGAHSGGLFCIVAISKGNRRFLILH